MTTTDFTLKFGKYKGQQFVNTPKSYQDWLLKQDWFKIPAKMDELSIVQKEMSKVSNSLKGWNGYSKKGQFAYDRMFQLEQMESDIMYCNCGNLNEVGRRDCGMDCGF
jgi:uncharacterized protein (DUF3820 family)